MMTRLALALSLLLTATFAGAQAVKGSVPEDADPPELTYRGLIPGQDTLTKVREVLGRPEFEAFWYNFKMLYPAEGRPGMIDTIHLHGDKPESGLANIEAASVPRGLEREEAIVERFGQPEYTLIMHSWKLLDYSELGFRFTLDREGNTTGVAYFPHGQRRVPAGERRVVDLTHLAQHPKRAAGDGFDGLEAAAGEVVISPAQPSWIPVEFKVVRALKARYVVLRQGRLTVALVGADLFGMGYQDVALIRREAAKLGIDHVVFGMSHTHSAGDTIGVYGFYPARFIGHIQETVVAGLKEALTELEPVTEVRAASGELPMDGARVMGLIRNARNPGLMDPTVNLVQVFGEDGPIASISHITCHPESIEAGVAEIDPDFPGYLCDALSEQDMGQPIFLNGALGGMISGDNRERTHESSQEVGERFAEIMVALADDAEPVGGSKLHAERRRLELPMTNERFKPLMEDSGMREMVQGRIVTDMIYVALGDAQFVTLPGELLPEVSFEILEHMEGFPRMLVGLGNDQLGYIVPPYDFRAGAYEESMSVGPATAYSVRDMALRMVREKM